MKNLPCSQLGVAVVAFTLVATSGLAQARDTPYTFTTLAVLGGIPGSADGTGSVARFYHPRGVAVDSADNVYVADWGNHTIRKGVPLRLTISWSAPADVAYGTALSGAQLNATARVPGTFTYSPAAGTVLNAGSGRTLSVSFVPADTATSSPVIIVVSPFDVLVANEQQGTGMRTLTQPFQVWSGTNEVSLAERKRLFQNAVWWLLQRGCAYQRDPEHS